MNLEELKNKSLLLFGKSRAFSSEEFLDQMKHYGITVVREYSDDVFLVIDGRMMTPYEQNESDALYESGKAKSISIDVLEKLLAKEIDEDTLLMSLKLSHDTERLKSFLENSTITDTLFLRLVQLYSWSGEDFFENDDNRDVTAAFISRFYENIERNHNVQYATTGLLHLVAQAKDAELLQAIGSLEPLKFHPKIKSAIAMSVYCNGSMQKRFFKTQESYVLEGLSLNANLTRDLVEIFEKDDDLGVNVARSITLDEELFRFLARFSSALAMNQTLSVKMQERLLASDDKEIHHALSLNDNLDAKIIQKLLQLEDEKIELAIYENASTPVKILQKAYEEDEKNHLALAKNISTPVAILYQLQLDSRYERAVKTNAGFGKHIQTENIGWKV